MYLKLSFDDSRINTASDYKTAKCFDKMSGTCINTFYGHSIVISYLEFSKDESKLYTASRDNTAKC